MANAKEKAIATDKKLRALQEKADQAQTDEELRSAYTAYFQALYARMRKLEPDLTDRIDQIERATLRKVEGLAIPPPQE